MIQPLDMSVGTVVVLALVAAWVAWAARRLFFRGMCDCRDQCGDAAGAPHRAGSCGGCGGCSGCAGCAGCSVSVIDAPET